MNGFALACVGGRVRRRLAIDIDRIIRLADGRAFGLRSYGVLGGQPVLCLHGTPGSRLKFRMAGASAAEHGLRLYCPDRWGYGLSSAPRRKPTLAGFAADIREVTEALGLTRFSVVGISGGGPYAAAVAAELPERIDRLALIAPVGPIAPATESQRPFDRFHRFTFTALPKIPGGIRLTFSAFRLLLALNPALAVTAVAARAHAADRNIFRDRSRAHALGETMRAGLGRGAIGPVIDMGLFSTPWNVDLGAIRAPACVWLGRDDRNVPLGPARRLAQAIPGAKLHEIPGAGHFWIMLNFDQVFDWLDGRPG